MIDGVVPTDVLLRELAIPRTAIQYRRQSGGLTQGRCAWCDLPRHFGDRVVLVKRGSPIVFVMHEECWDAFRAETSGLPALRIISRGAK